ncbi:integrin alpha-PS2 isoform X2 [Cylas formicarius]|uniref:integrin alpha-PS2 isoform X2 n=1 Tax=Cylas formicarius TaxID=197179 RepID=UPI0029589F60|nr:integrin alpha-PS2 isoform X2 [Cylas formicarius]
MSSCVKVTIFALSVIVLCSLNAKLVNSFNIDAFNYAVYERSEKSMFGFTVAVHKQKSASWVLVGAPEAQAMLQDQSVYKGGVVYRCRPDGDDVCDEIPFDRTGNQYIGNKELDHKSMQWFGATLATSGRLEGGPVVACAPRYVWYSKEMNRRDPVGTCFVADEFFEKFEEYSPCRTSNWGYHRQGSCQAGFSAAINSMGDRLFVGAPGSYYWQGSVHQQSLENRPAVFQTREGKKEDDDSYLGYSAIVGDFEGIGQQGVAVGMPRGADLHGKILLFSWNLTNYKNISGNQLGSYFGYSLAAADVDGDKKIDLIVGAPMHTEPNTEGHYDVGRVYVFYQGGGFGSFNKSSFLDGENSMSRFGLSLASLGDMNQDGYDDFAVGAPYDGPNGQGAVYIFYGSVNGVLKKYGQVIYAEDIQTRSGKPIATFGFSVGGGLDMDGNDYPDLAVGAYLSDSVFFFRARPVVRVDAFVRFQTQKKQIDIQNKNCNLPNGQRGTCTTIDFCIKYGGKGIPPQIKLDLQYILDTKKFDVPRMAFISRNSHTFKESLVLYKDSSHFCKSEEIYIKNDIRDKLTALEAEVKYFMIEDLSSGYYGKVRDPRSRLTPVLDLNSPPSRKDSISIQKNCGFDNICIPNLHVNVIKNVEKYLLDSNTNLEFDVVVSNFGEDSFETTFYLTFPEGIYYKKTEGALCSTRENNTITCDVGNPLQTSKIAKFKVIFVPYHKQEMAPSYDFDFFVNSTNPEENSTLSDNHKRIRVDIWVETKLDVNGRSIPQEIYLPNASTYTADIRRESDIGPQVTHLYTLRNKGPATVYEAEVYFFWPWQTLGGEDLLYLLDQPHVPEGIKCDIPAPANYKNYELDYYTKSIWERLRIDSSSKYGEKYGEHSVVHVETGANIPAIVGGTTIKGQNSMELDEKIKQSGGDASEIFNERHNINATSGQSSTGNTSLAGVTVYTKSEWTTVIQNGKPVTKWTNVTTVKDASGKILNTYYSTDNDGSQNERDSFGQKVIGIYEKPAIQPTYSSSGNGPSQPPRLEQGRHRQEERLKTEESRRQGEKWRSHDQRSNSTWPSSRTQINYHDADNTEHQEGSNRQQAYEERLRTEEFRRQQGERWRAHDQRNNSTWVNSKTQSNAGHYQSGRNEQTLGSSRVDNINAGQQNIYHNYGQGSSGERFQTTAIELDGLGSMLGRQSIVLGRPQSSEAEFSGGESEGYQWQSSGRRIHSGTIARTDDETSSENRDYRNSRDHQNSNSDLRTRTKRQIEPLDPDIDQIRKCETTNCIYVRCIVSTLKRDEFVSIALRSRLNLRAVKHLSSSQPFKLSSVMVARISKLPYIGRFKDQNPLMHEVFTDIPAKEPEVPPRIVPLWIILLSAIAGTIILLLVILFLYKCGFFRRNRPSSTPERQPLNRNGYQNGDEAL